MPDDETETVDTASSTDTEPKATATDETDTGESASEESGEGNVKVPEEFQKQATALVQSCDSVSALDFLQSEVSEMRQKLMSSQKSAGLNKDDFTSAEMPS